MQKKLKTVIYETEHQRFERLEKEFHAIEMGRSSHTEFRAAWEEKLDELEEAGVVVMTEASWPRRLYHQYLAKLTAELRQTVLSKVWPLDGEDKPSRKPSIWEEVAQAVDMELGSRADARAPTESINAMGDGSIPASSTQATPTAQSKHCKRPGHPPEICPFKAAERRGHVEKMLKENEANPERVCAYCGAADHRDYHHRLGTSDANYTLGQNGNTLSWNGGSSSIKYTPKGVTPIL